jgi:glycosyltransferase involved in cell wall biosynthesis
MLCGCIPVGTKVGGIPEAVGDLGPVVPPEDSDAIAVAVRTALRSPEELRTRVRARIAMTFPLARRRQALAQLLGELCP